MASGERDGAARHTERLVVAAAIVVEGRVLVARRTGPGATAGRWELPGGKVEPGEEPAAALCREVAEELGCTIAPVGWLRGRTRITDGLALAVAHARLEAGHPTPREHDALQWLGRDELDAVDWLEPDRPFLPAIRALLGDGTASSTALGSEP